MAPRHAALALLAAAACAGKEAELMKERGRACLALVAPPAVKTMEDAQLALEIQPLAADCPTASTLPGNSTCAPDADLCRFVFLFIPGDSALCGVPPGGGCGYLCEVWTPAAEGEAWWAGGGFAADQVPICASTWITKAAGCVGPYCF